MTEQRKCPVDGQPIPRRATGRPARFCSEPCRRVADQEVRILARELERLEMRRNAALIEAATGDPFGYEESSWAADRRAEARAISRRITDSKRRLRDLYESLASEAPE